MKRADFSKMQTPNELRRNSLSFPEVLATSVALIGPSMTPVLIAPYMFQNAGNGSWLAYVFGGVMLLFVALNLNQFTRREAAAGSMYRYATQALGSTAGSLAGWSLVWAYTCVAAAVLGAMALFVNQLLGDAHAIPPAIVVILVAALCWQAAYRGVQSSALIMLVLETISVALICMLVLLVLGKHGFRPDVDQLTLKNVSPRGVGLGIATAIFSLVGFESATAFGEEARSPLRTIPRAVTWSVVIASLFFMVAVYSEILGLRGSPTPLDQLTSPLGTLAGLLRVPYLRIPITIGALCSAFSVALACVTTCGRVLLAMAERGIAPRSFARIEPKHATPHVAVTVSTVIAALLALGALAVHVAPVDVFNDFGTLSSLGFIVIYAFVAIAAPAYVRRIDGRSPAANAIAAIALLCLLVPAVTLFVPLPDPPQRWFPYAFLVYLGVAWAVTRRRTAATASA